MPLQICPRCKRFHYVPGACPTETRIVGGSITPVDDQLVRDFMVPGTETITTNLPLEILNKAEAKAAHLAPTTTTRGTPRQRAPKGTVDRKAYQAEKARRRRARKKQEGN